MIKDVHVHTGDNLVPWRGRLIAEQGIPRTWRMDPISLFVQ